MMYIHYFNCHPLIRFICCISLGWANSFFKKNKKKSTDTHFGVRITTHNDWKRLWGENNHPAEAKKTLLFDLYGVWRWSEGNSSLCCCIENHSKTHNAQKESSYLNVCYFSTPHVSLQLPPSVFPSPGELGDCDPLEHSPELVSEFRFSPKQSEAMEADIFGRWLELRWVDARAPAPAKVGQAGVPPAVCHVEHLGEQKPSTQQQRKPLLRCLPSPAGASKFHSSSLLLLLCVCLALTGLQGGIKGLLPGGSWLIPSSI